MNEKNYTDLGNESETFEDEMSSGSGSRINAADSSFDTDENLFSEDYTDKGEDTSEAETAYETADVQTETQPLSKETAAESTSSQTAGSADKFMPHAQNTKRTHPAMMLAACAALSLLCGFGGATLAVKGIGGKLPSIVYTSTEAGTSKLSNVSSNGTGLTISQAADKAAPSIVEVEVEITSNNYWFGGAYTSTGAGSGVIISDDGYIVTNNHVVEGATAISITTYDGKQYDAELVGTDAKSDIAVIKVNADNLVPATIGDSSKITVGDTAIVIGNPLGTLGGTVTDGIISAVSREVIIDQEAMELIQTNAAINSGNSGGGLFDGNGNLIGIVNSKDTGTTSSGAVIEGLGFAIPANTAMDVAQQLIQYGKVTNRATLGVYLQTIPNGSARYEAGLYISDVISGSGAEKAGLQPYDRIVTADGVSISAYTDLSSVLKNKKPGDNLEISVARNGQTLTFNVTLTGTLD